MATVVTLNGHRATHLRAHLPAWGAWYVEASLEGEFTLPTTARGVTVVVNDLTLVGTVLSGGPSYGRSIYRIVGGAGGLARDLPKKSYANDAGVKVSTVVGDALREAGELFEVTSTERLGPAWTRPEGPASRVLESISSRAWYVDNTGTVRLGARTASTYTGSAPRVSSIDRAHKRLTLAPEQIAALVPGCSVDGLEAVDVEHEAAPDGLRTTIYGKGVATSSALLDSYQRLFDALDPDRMFRGTYEFRVVQQSGNRVDLQPVLSSLGLPDLQRVPMRPGLPGMKATLTPGSRVLVTWVNADPARPVVVGFDDPDSNGWRASSLTIDATSEIKLGAGSNEVAAKNDGVSDGVISATAQSKVKV